ncbi:hypothetical protein N7492_001098 [Penicillium capsulatum]|uniref:Uncharacterized protein n=1 Tax=Penicillium capsulatum TaxID=69766 RepID=A0A9W9IT06_9EURO|nr:hypothetical protein N7492_001098 [Penicillium capsulatum]KAJ6129844.1 hypothetical protein N7512_002624 [Penicillium capsulatum]
MRFSPAFISTLVLSGTALAVSPIETSTAAREVQSTQADTASQSPAPSVKADSPPDDSPVAHAFENVVNSSPTPSETATGIHAAAVTSQPNSTGDDEKGSLIPSEENNRAFTKPSEINSQTISLDSISPSGTDSAVHTPKASTGNAAKGTATATRSPKTKPSSTGNATYDGSDDDDTLFSSLDDFGDFFDGIKGLLSPNLLQDIESFFHHFAWILDDQTTTNTKQLINTASGLLAKKGLIDKIEGLLDSASELLTPEVTKQLKQLLGTVLPAIKPELFKEINNLLSNGNKLLTPEVVDQLKGLIATVAPAIKPELLEEVNALLTNGNKLLTPHFVEQLNSLIGTVVPAITPELLKEVNSLLSHGNELLTTEFVAQAKGLIGTVSPFIKPELFAQINSLLSNGNKLLTPEVTNQLKGLLETLAPVITPDLLKEVNSLLSNGNKLLTPEFVSNTQGLISTVAPYVTPELLKEVNGLLSNANTLLTADMTREIGKLLSSANRLLTVVGPAVTPELMGNATALLGNGTTLLTPPFIQKVGGLLGNAGDLLDKKLVNETRILVEDASEVSHFPPLVKSSAYLRQLLPIAMKLLDSL